MRVGVITNRNLGSPWASTHFYIHRALCRQGISAVHVAGKEIADYHASRTPRKNGRARKIGRSQVGKQTDPFTPKLTEAVERDVQEGGYDALIALHASTVIPALSFECPLIYVTDATAALLNAYYPQRQELSVQDIERLQECEEITIGRSDAIVVPTQWAADSVLQDYSAEPSRVHTVEWGGNLDSVPAPLQRSPYNGNRPLRFLFVGLDWHRKGGDIATKTVQLLCAKGIEATLTVVGSPIPRKDRCPFVRSVGKLNRAIPEESARLDQLFQTADFYIHPARAECYGHVLCEALGFGVPALATRTGGISQCVIDGETGLLLPPEASAEEFAERVLELLADAPLLSAMRANAIEDYRNRLNWDRWALRMQEILLGLLSPTVSTSSDRCES